MDQTGTDNVTPVHKLVIYLAPMFIAKLTFTFLKSSVNHYYFFGFCSYICL
uniref:Uncharacterized protein n=1 Tax=Rhizophora mucronata TaxID=61149 RepID=A0A2P2P1I8_RHIMU